MRKRVEKIEKIFQNFNFLCTFRSFWPIFGQFTDPPTNYYGQKSIERPKLLEKSVFSKIVFIKLAKQVIQTRNFAILFLFFKLFSTFCTFWPIYWPHHINCKVQKSIQLPKLHGKSVISLNKFHKIWKSSTKTVKKWSKTTYGLY